MAEKNKTLKDQCVCITKESFYGVALNDFNGKEDDFMSLKYKIEDGFLVLDYNAYSCDSSFDAKLPIWNCPFCGRKLRYTVPIVQKFKEAK